MAFELPELDAYIDHVLPKLGVSPQQLAACDGAQESIFVRSWRAFKPFLESDAGKLFLAELRSDERIRLPDGKMFSAGYSAYPLDLQMLSLWYLWLRAVRGRDRADHSLKAFLDDPDITTNVLVGIAGLRTQSDADLANNVRLIRPTSLPPGMFKERATPFLSRPLLGRDAVPDSYLAGRLSISKVTSSLPAGPDPSLKRISDWSEAAIGAALLINCLPRLISIPVCTTTLLDEDIPPGPFGGASHGSTHVGRTIDYDSEFDTSYIPELTKLCSALRSKSASDLAKWRHRLSRLAAAKAAGDASDAALELGICLEMMLLSGPGEQLSQTFRLRGSWLLEPSDFAARQCLFKDLKVIYECRSDVAHAGLLKPKNRSLFEANRAQYLGIAERVASALVLRNVKDDEWDAVILGGTV